MNYTLFDALLRGSRETTFFCLSFQTVKRNQQQYDLPLKIVSYEELYGWTMDAIVKQIGLKNNCTHSSFQLGFKLITGSIEMCDAYLILRCIEFSGRLNLAVLSHLPSYDLINVYKRC